MLTTRIVFGADTVWILSLYLVVLDMAVSGPDFNHLTRVGISLFGAYAAFGCLHAEHYYYWFALTMGLIINIGVVVLSVSRCHVFEEAYNKYGIVWFAIGTFVEHGLPWIIVVAMGDRKSIYCSVWSAVSQIWTALGLYLTWSYIDSPNSVYGCRLPNELGPIGALLATVFMQFIVLFIQ